MELPLCVVSSWVIKRVYTILISNTISGSSNIDICFYYCLILTLISHLKDLFNSLLHYIYIYIYIVDLPVDRPRSCRVIYYFDTLALGIRHQLFDRITKLILSFIPGYPTWIPLAEANLIIHSRLSNMDIISQKLIPSFIPDYPIWIPLAKHKYHLSNMDIISQKLIPSFISSYPT